MNEKLLWLIEKMSEVESNGDCGLFFSLECFGGDWTAGYMVNDYEPDYLFVCRAETPEIAVNQLKDEIEEYLK